MSIRFAEWLLTNEAENPMDAFLKLRQQSGMDNADAGRFRSVQPDQSGATPAPAKTTYGGSQKPPIPPAVMDILQNGFAKGGLVPDQIVRFLDLNGSRRSFVSDSMLLTGNQSYPFVREKKGGTPTGKIHFVQHYPIQRFLNELS
jgi:hypothetical protein